MFLGRQRCCREHGPVCDVICSAPYTPLSCRITTHSLSCWLRTFFIESNSFASGHPSLEPPASKITFFFRSVYVRFTFCAGSVCVFSFFKQTHTCVEMNVYHTERLHAVSPLLYKLCFTFLSRNPEAGLLISNFDFQHLTHYS